jgi:hypothetical protein
MVSGSGTLALEGAGVSCEEEAVFGGAGRGGLNQADLGMPIAHVIRQVGISEQTFYRRKKQYTRMELEQVRELKQLQEENARLKKLGGAQPRQGDPAGYQRKKMDRPPLKRQAVTYILGHYRTNRRRACRLVGQHRSMQYYQSCKDPKTALRARMRELAQGSGSDMVIGACTFCCGVKAGHWARSRPIGSTPKSTCNCARSGHVVGRCS